MAYESRRDLLAAQAKGSGADADDEDLEAMQRGRQARMGMGAADDT